MNINHIKTDGLKSFFEATISKEDILNKETQELQKIAQSANLKGFRKGKAPLEVIKRNYEQSVLVKVFESLTKEFLLKIYKDHKIIPISEPKIDIIEGDLMKKDDLKLTLEIESYPDIPSIDLKSITLNKINLNITEEDINSFLNKLSEHYFNYIDSNEDRPLQMGDIAEINFIGKIDNKEFEGGSAKNFNLELGSRTFIDGFEEQLVGLKPNEEVTVNVTFPEEYKYKKELAGKDASFLVKIHKIKKKEKSPIEDLPNRLGLTSLDDLKKDIKERHIKQYETVLKHDMKNQFIENIVEKIDFALPHSLIEREKKVMEEDFKKYKSLKEANITHQNKAYDNKTDEEVYREHAETAKKKIKLSLILNNIADNNKIYVYPEEVEEFINKEAIKFGDKARDFIKSYKSNQQILNNIRSIILENKIFDFIFSQVALNEKTMSLSEYNQSLKPDKTK